MFESIRLGSNKNDFEKVAKRKGWNILSNYRKVCGKCGKWMIFLWKWYYRILWTNCGFENLEVHQPKFINYFHFVIGQIWPPIQDKKVINLLPPQRLKTSNSYRISLKNFPFRRDKNLIHGFVKKRNQRSVSEAHMNFNGFST